MVYKEVPVTSSDGYSIKCYFFPAQKAKKITHDIYNNAKKLTYLSYPKNRTIIVANGDGGNMMNMLFYIHSFACNGFNVACFDWRGFGESSAWQTDPNILCYAEYLDDYNAVINKVNSLAEVGGIGLFGVSTGAYLSLAVAKQNNNVDCFVGRALITDFEEVLLNLHKLKPDRKLSYPKNYPTELLPINASKDFKKAALLIVGENDKRTPVEMSQRIYNNLQGKKELWVVENAGHGGDSAPEIIAKQEFWSKVLSFFNDNLDS
jgi:pimeloyl-ACP methyl ester carboxylesterase